METIRIAVPGAENTVSLFDIEKTDNMLEEQLRDFGREALGVALSAAYVDRSLEGTDLVCVKPVDSTGHTTAKLAQDLFQSGEFTSLFDVA